MSKLPKREALRERACFIYPQSKIPECPGYREVRGASSALRQHSGFLCSEDTMSEIPKGFCQCGCGGKAPLASRNRKDKFCNWVEGEPIKYINGHAGKRNLEGYGVRQGADHPSWNGGKTITNGYVFLMRPGHPRANPHGYAPEHVLIAEKSLGKPLPPKAVVHHHSREQLVVCQDQAYHLLLHQRGRALATCGHANWRKCVYCKTYDDPAKLVISSKPRKAPYHKDCKNLYQRENYENKQATNKQFSPN